MNQPNLFTLQPRPAADPPRDVQRPADSLWQAWCSASDGEREALLTRIRAAFLQTRRTKPAGTPP